MPLAPVRERLQETHALVARGIARAIVRKTVGLTFEEVAQRRVEHWSICRHQRRAYDFARRLEVDVFPRLGAKPIADMPSSAFRDTVAHDFAGRNPVADVKPADILTSHKSRNYPRVDEAEWPTLLRAIDSYSGGEHTRLALQRMALTFVRTSELIEARWSEFDMKADRWNIPAERMKMDTPHIVPLSRQAKVALGKLSARSFGRKLVLPGDMSPNRPMSNNTLLSAQYRMSYRSRMTGLGFRGVASTILHEQGWPHERIELQLAHQHTNAVSAACNHALYVKPLAEMMQAWANHLDTLRETPIGSELRMVADRACALYRFAICP